MCYVHKGNHIACNPSAVPEVQRQKRRTYKGIYRDGQEQDGLTWSETQTQRKTDRQTDKQTGKYIDKHGDRQKAWPQFGVWAHTQQANFCLLC